MDHDHEEENGDKDDKHEKCDLKIEGQANLLIEVRFALKGRNTGDIKPSWRVTLLHEKVV